MPIEPAGLGLLHVWPARRRLVGFRLQLAVLSGFDREMLWLLAERLLRERPGTVNEISNYPSVSFLKDKGELGALARDWAVQELPGSWTTRRCNEIRSSWIFTLWERCLFQGESWLQQAGEDAEWRWTWSRDYGAAETLAAALGVPGPARALRDFVLLDVATPARSAARAFLAHRAASAARPEVVVISAACQDSLNPIKGAARLDAALSQYGNKMHPLWVALSRHVARRSDTADRALLTEAAEAPEKLEPELATGLRYIVRGDILLDDGSEVTLDQLAEDAGVPPLPYLEEIPEDLTEEAEVDVEEPRS